MRLACRLHGEGRALVVTPGGPGGYGVLWDWVLAPLTDAYRLVLWDHRGCGESTPTTDCSMARDQADLAAVITELGGPHPVLLGHSYGGMLSLMHALDAPPDAVGGLVLANTLAGYGDLVAGSQRRAAALDEHTRERAGDLLGLLVRGEATEAELAEHRALTGHLGFHDPRHGERVAGLQHNNYPVRLAVQRDIYLYNARPRLPEVSVPTLVTGSAHDLTCGDVPREIAAGIPGARYAHFENSAHAPHLEEREAFLEAVREFLSGLAL